MDELLEPDVRHELGTDEFLFCNYVSASRLKTTTTVLLDRMKKLSLAEQKRDLLKLDPSAVLSVALTYYTGKADTVAHIPERCYVGDGFDPVNPSDETWTLSLSRQPKTQEVVPLPVRCITFEGERDRVQRHVAYFFQVNGRYIADSLGVRAQLQDLFARYGYYAKVELMCTTPKRDQAQSV